MRTFEAHPRFGRAYPCRARGNIAALKGGIGRGGEIRGCRKSECSGAGGGNTSRDTSHSPPWSCFTTRNQNFRAISLCDECRGLSQQWWPPPSASWKGADLHRRTSRVLRNSRPTMGRLPPPTAHGDPPRVKRTRPVFDSRTDDTLHPPPTKPVCVMWSQQLVLAIALFAGHASAFHYGAALNRVPAGSPSGISCRGCTPVASPGLKLRSGGGAFTDFSLEVGVLPDSLARSAPSIHLTAAPSRALPGSCRAEAWRGCRPRDDVEERRRWQDPRGRWGRGGCDLQGHARRRGGL